MKLVGFGKRTAAVMAVSFLVNAAGAVADTSEQLAICKSALKVMYGEETRVQMYGTKSYRGVTTLKLKVTPAGDSSTTLQCSGDAESDQQVVLKDKNGVTLVS